jgi:hypothetical protein
MSKKNFLPLSQHEVEMPMMNEGAVAAVAAMGSNVYNDTVTQNKAKGNKAKTWFMKMFSVFLFIGLIFGGTVMGFSVKIISDNQVGYYNNEPGYVTSGVYFQFPWTKEEMHIVDVGPNITKQFDNIIFQRPNDHEFAINANVIYNVSDVGTYVKTIKNVKTNTQCETNIENVIILNTHFNSKYVSLGEFEDTEIPDCGIIVKQATIVKKSSILYSRQCMATCQADQPVVVTSLTTDPLEDNTEKDIKKKLARVIQTFMNTFMGIDMNKIELNDLMGVFGFGKNDSHDNLNETTTTPVTWEISVTTTPVTTTPVTTTPVTTTPVTTTPVTTTPVTTTLRITMTSITEDVDDQSDQTTPSLTEG